MDSGTEKWGFREVQEQPEVQIFTTPTLNQADSSEDSDEDSLTVYRMGCRILGVAPSPRAANQWKGPAINLNFKNIGPSGAKALTSALITNSDVTSLELEENRLGGIGGMYVCTYLKENIHITRLNLSRNNLGSMGAMALGELFQINKTLKHANLSDNNFRDSDGEHLARAIEAAPRLLSLNLSHNEFSEDGATRIGRAIGRNNSLENLDFSWNQLRRKGAGSVCAGIKRNINITQANLSWNGLGYEGSVALSEMLAGNLYLFDLDVTSNRINWEGARLVARGLAQNQYLQVLKIGKNPLTTTGCHDLVVAIDGNDESTLEVLDVRDVPVNKSIMEVFDQIKSRRSFTMTHGGIMESEDIIGRRHEAKKDPIQQLMDFLTARGIRPVDLFRTLKMDDKKMVTKDSFLQGLQSFKIPMKQHDIDKILDSIDYNNEGKISFNLLMKGVKDQIRVNREEEKRRVEMEDRFNEEKRRLMTLTPPDPNRDDLTKDKPKRKLKGRNSVMGSVPDSLSDDDMDKELNGSQNWSDSRASTPLPAMVVEVKRTPRNKRKSSLPGISDTDHLPNKSRQELSMTEVVNKSNLIRNNQRVHGRRRTVTEPIDKRPPRLVPLENWRTLPAPQEGEETVGSGLTVLPPTHEKSLLKKQGNNDLVAQSISGAAEKIRTWKSTEPPNSSLPSSNFSLGLDPSDNGSQNQRTIGQFKGGRNKKRTQTK